jgi:hypothetical protein
VFGAAHCLNNALSVWQTKKQVVNLPNIVKSRTICHGHSSFDIIIIKRSKIYIQRCEQDIYKDGSKIQIGKVGEIESYPRRGCCLKPAPANMAER